MLQLSVVEIASELKGSPSNVSRGGSLSRDFYRSGPHGRPAVQAETSEICSGRRKRESNDYEDNFSLGRFHPRYKGFVGSATASILNWELENVQFDDGGQMSGTFSVDTTVGVVTAFDITTKAGSILVWIPL